MEATISKNASQLAGDTIETFREMRRKRKVEKAEAERISRLDMSRTGVMITVALVLLLACLAQGMFF